LPAMQRRLLYASCREASSRDADFSGYGTMLDYSTRRVKRR
jgi:hypothetical protein